MEVAKNGSVFRVRAQAVGVLRRRHVMVLQRNVGTLDAPQWVDVSPEDIAFSITPLVGFPETPPLPVLEPVRASGEQAPKPPVVDYGKQFGLTVDPQVASQQA